MRPFNNRHECFTFLMNQDKGIGWFTLSKFLGILHLGKFQVVKDSLEMFKGRAD